MFGKKYIAVMGAALILCVGLSGCGKSESKGKNGLDKEINVFNWSEYLPENVIKQFEKKYDIKVNYDTYASNEEMLSKLMAGSSEYDIAVSSDYMVDIMKKQGLLQKIDMKNIPNFKNIDDRNKNMSFDPHNKYTVPYMWGNMVIAVNKKKVKKQITGYKDLWNPAFKNSMVVLDDQRAIIGMTLKKMGYSFNEKDPKILAKAKKELKKLTPNIKAYDSDSPKTSLINGEATIGLVWGAEASLARRTNPDIVTVLPKEGMYLWQDNFVIPKEAPHKKTAEVFINYLLDAKVSGLISKKFPYANPNKAAHQYIDKAILDDIAVYPPDSEIKKGEYLKDLGSATTKYDNIWSEIKN